MLIRRETIREWLLSWNNEALIVCICSWIMKYKRKKLWKIKVDKEKKKSFLVQLKARIWFLSSYCVKAREWLHVIVTLLSWPSCYGEPILPKHFLLLALRIGSAAQTCRDNRAQFKLEHINRDSCRFISSTARVLETRVILNLFKQLLQTVLYSDT